MNCVHRHRSLNQDELHDAHSPVAPLQQAPLVAARCVNGTLIRPSNAEGDHPSTACHQSEVCAPGGVQLGRGNPGHQQSPGGRRGRDIDPPPPPPPPPAVPHATAAPNPVTYPVQWTPLHTKAKAPGGGGGGPPGGPPNIQGMAAVHGVTQAAIHQEEALDQEEALGQEERDHLHRHHPHQEEGVQEEAQEQVPCREELHPSSPEEEQVIQGLHHLQALHNLYAHQIHGVHSIGPGRRCRSSCYPPTTRHAAYWK